jgi:N-acetylglutamate synthase-like GNAT family acetyltransferase
MVPPESLNIQMDDPFADDSTFRLKAKEQNAPRLVNWLNNNTEGTPLVINPPYVNIDLWAVLDDNDDLAAGVAIESEDDHSSVTKLNRIAVAEDYREQGLASTLIEQLSKTYGQLSANCPINSDSNGWYYHTGWTYHGLNRVSNPDLVQWRYTPDSG